VVARVCGGFCHAIHKFECFRVAPCVCLGFFQHGEEAAKVHGLIKLEVVVCMSCFCISKTVDTKGSIS
jgi:hypothetical protein